jgi:3,4-dehydroadipyl-CoA semialdehyde dehydrogenase
MTRTLRSFVGGSWHEAESGFVPLVDPATEEEIGRASSTGVEFAAALEWARHEGGPALRRRTIAERGALLKAMSKALREHRDELLDLSRRNNGTTATDGAFDIDGATGTLAYYAAVAKGLGERKTLVEGEGIQLSRTEGFWGQHLLVPKHGAAVHINAFNFPAWGFAEKAACALAAGMPIITKPATATALVAERCVEIIVEAGLLPAGALQLISGSTGNLLDLMGPQDVLAFTGSAATALGLRRQQNLLAANTRFNLEADSLNAAILGPSVSPETTTMSLFLDDVVREMTQKAGQKCTAVRRIVVPADRLETVQRALEERLAEVVAGNTADESVTMGPLATAGQLEDAVRGVAELGAEAELVFGSGERIDGVGAEPGRGFFFGPTLLQAADAYKAASVHQREVFGPVATLLAYDGTAAAAAEINALAGGTLVTSIYDDEPAWIGELVSLAGGTTGRIYIGSEAAAAEAPGSGVALPQTLHGGPGRAGGGEELGGLVGVKLYMQRVALQGSRAMVEDLAG